MNNNKKNASSADNSEPHNEKNHSPHIRLNDKTIAVPFGTYSSDKKSSSITNEVYVGREKERASFIHRLLHSGRSGSFLVTGSRGVGKSSFVNYCINELGKYYSTRALFANAGRHLSDMIFIFILAGLLAFYPSVISHFISILLPKFDTKVYLPIIAFLVFLSLIPLFISKRFFDKYVYTKQENVLKIASLFNEPSSDDAEDKEHKRRCIDLILNSVYFRMLMSTGMMLILFFLCGQRALYFIFLYYSLVYFSALQRNKQLENLESTAKYCSHDKKGVKFWEKNIHNFPFLAIASVFFFSLFAIFCEDVKQYFLVLVFIMCLAVSALWTIYSIYKTDRCTNKHNESSYKLNKQAFIPSHLRILIRATPNVLIVLSISILAPLIFYVANNVFELEHITLFKEAEYQFSYLTIFLLFLLTILINYTQYRLIIVPGREFVEESSSTSEDVITQRIGSNNKLSAKNKRKLLINLRSYYRTANECCIPHLLYMFWLPLIKVKINLGFDTVDHPAVIKAMLTGLRDEYIDRFTSRSSYRWLFFHMSFTALAIILGLILSSMLFAPKVPTEPSTDSIDTPFAAGLMAIAGLDQFSKLTYLNVVQISKFESIPLLGQLEVNPSVNCIKENEQVIKKHFFIVGNFQCFIESYNAKEKNNPSYYVQTHDLLMIVLVVLVFFWLGRRYSLIPYRNNLLLIDQLLEDLTGERSSTKKYMGFPFNRKGTSLNSELKSEQESLKTPATDSRTIEYKMLAVLESIQKRRKNVLGLRFSLPAPLVIFVFDELDKLTDREEIAHSTREQVESKRHHIQTVISQRQHKIHHLLSEMKGLLSSGSAKFIFIGGRDLHDSWLSDKTERNPLLSSVFDHQIYIATLLQRFGKEHDEMYQYFYQQYRRAWRINSEFQHLKSRTILTASASDRKPIVYQPEGLKKHDIIQRLTRPLSDISNNKKSKLHNMPLQLIRANQDIKNEAYSHLFLTAFIDFLAFRSQGNPRKLDEYLSSFIRPKAAFVKKQQDRGTWTTANVSDKQGKKNNQNKHNAFDNCTTMLVFNDINQIRIQLLSQVFERLYHHFQAGIHGRDDRVINSIFYFTDFLFKFHKQPFSWTSIDKIDEMSDITRSPDTRSLMHSVVEALGPIFFDKILLGTKSHRFKSEFSVELDFISRMSKTEMAAMNFTLDESTPLRELYLAKLNDHGSKDVELHIDIGEMYENDEIYESARHHYRMAIHHTDEKLTRYFGFKFGSNEGNSPGDIGKLFLGVINGKDEESLQTFFSWFTNRIYLIMQIALTHEKSRDFEQAKNLYQQTLNTSLNILNTIKSCSQHLAQKEFLEYAHVIYQPFFCLLWISEKTPSQFGLSNWVIQRYLDEFFPIASENDSLFNNKQGNTDTNDLMASVNLAKAEGFNKLGDFYFLKGKHYVTSHEENGNNCSYPLSTNVDYNKLAENYYIKAIRNIKSGITAENFETHPFPEFILQTMASSTIDLAEVFLSRCCISQFPSYSNNSEKQLHCNIHSAARAFLNANDDSKLTNIIEKNSPLTMYFAMVNISITAHMKSGYLESAISEYLRAVSICNQLILSYLQEYTAPSTKDSNRENAINQVIYVVRELITKSYLLSKRSSSFHKKTMNTRSMNPVSSISELSGTINKTPQHLSLLQVPQVRHYLTTLIYLKDIEPHIQPGQCLNSATESVVKIVIAILKPMCISLEDSVTDNPCQTLVDLLELYRFPILNRLEGLTAILHSKISQYKTDNNSVSIVDICERGKEIEYLQRQVDAPLHFPYASSGLLFYRLWQILEPGSQHSTADSKQIREEREFWLYRANIHLKKSRETYTLGREYYALISELYYLHDDFNDRNIHFSHALQMLNSDWVTSSITTIDDIINKLQ